MCVLLCIFWFETGGSELTFGRRIWRIAHKPSLTRRRIVQWRVRRFRSVCLFTVRLESSLAHSRGQMPDWDRMTRSHGQDVDFHSVEGSSGSNWMVSVTAFSFTALAEFRKISSLILRAWNETDPNTSSRVPQDTRRIRCTRDTRWINCQKAHHFGRKREHLSGMHEHEPSHRILQPRKGTSHALQLMAPTMSRNKRVRYTIVKGSGNFVCSCGRVNDVVCSFGLILQKTKRNEVAALTLRKTQPNSMNMKIAPLEHMSLPCEWKGNCDAINDLSTSPKSNHFTDNDEVVPEQLKEQEQQSI